MTSETEREQAAPRMVTLTESEVSHVEGRGREANGGWESWQGSKVQDPQSIGTWVNSAVWVWERAGHKGQELTPSESVLLASDHAKYRKEFIGSTDC
jgi:hypothetical protein